MFRDKTTWNNFNRVAKRLFSASIRILKKKCKNYIVAEFILGRPLFVTILSVFMPTSILLVLSQMVRVFGKDHLEMVIEVNLTLLLVLATL